MHFRLATPDEFFRSIGPSTQVPDLSGEIPSAWANIITSMSHLWPPAMTATDSLLTAEKFAAINYALGYADYPQAEFERLWKMALEVMDHNNFGQGGDVGDTRKIEYAQTVIHSAGQILRDMLRNLAERVSSPLPHSTPIVVFNPLNWQRDDLVKAHVSLYGDVAPGDIADYRKGMRLVDGNGNVLPFYLEGYSGTVSRAVELVFLARDVPSLGYKTYYLVPSDRAEAFTNVCSLKLDNPDAAKPKRILGEDQVENEFYRVTVDRATGRLTVFDKELNQAVTKGMEIAAAEQRGGDSLSNERATGRTIVNVISRVDIEENNAVRAVLRIEGDLAGIPVTQKVFLYSGLKRIDLENTLDWKQGRFMMIEQLFPWEHPGTGIRYGVPFGSVGALDIMPDAGPHFGDEVPREIWQKWRQIQDWIFVGNPEWGVTFAADRQLVTLEEGVIRVGLLRGCYSPVNIIRADQPFLRQFPPAGRYVFRYSLTSGKGDWAKAKSYRVGMGFSNPLVPVTAVDELSTKTLPPSRSFCSLAADNLVVTAMKKTERDDSVVLRAVEMEGAQVETSVEFGGEKAVLRSANLLEEETRPTVEPSWTFKPYEINTARVRIR